MKRNVILTMATMIFVMAITSFGQISGQTASPTTIKPAPVITPAPVAKGKPGLGRILVQKEKEAQADAMTVIPTASQVLANIMDEINSGKVPAAIYPPGLLDNLKKMGNQPIRSAMSFDPAAYALKAGDKANMSWLDATFLMGSPSTEAERNSDEAQHTPIISYAFYIGNYEVTQNEYQQVVGSNPSWFTSANGFTDDLNRPVENVTWNQAVNYCTLLTAQEQANGHISSTWAYRLPTETEWEYSCRRGATTHASLWNISDDSVRVPVNVTQINDLGTGVGFTGISGTYFYASFPMDYNGSTGIYAFRITDGDTGTTYYGIDPSATTGAGCYTTPNMTGNGGSTKFTNTLETGVNIVYKAYPCGASLTFNPTHHYTLIFEKQTGGDMAFYGSTGATAGNLASHLALYADVAAPSSGSDGTLTAFNFGSGIHGGYANFDDHYEYDAGVGSINITTPTIPQLNITADVGSYDANGFGLYDMHGNTAEWCQDYYGTYPSGTVVDPQGPTSGSLKIVRGGSWADAGTLCRSAIRSGVNPSTASSHIGFRIVLAPTTPEWKTAVVTQPSAKTYGVPPTKTEDGLVLITHGWTPKELNISFPSDPTWVDPMSNSIVTYLNSHSITGWQVCGYRWIQNSWTSNPMDALNNATQEGINLGNSIVNQGWTKVHFISHSAGAQLIETAAEVIKVRAPNTIVQCTFLDPFVGFDLAGKDTYGIGADWSDRYASHNDFEVGRGIFTDVPLSSSYNVDITALDPSLANSGLFSGLSGYALCSLHEATHSWAIQFYENSITGNVTSDYDGFGFLLSMEAGGWPSAPTAYPVGNVNSVRVLGNAPQSCSLIGAIAATVGIPINFTTAPKAAQSTSGTITTSGGTLTFVTGSPVWLSIVPTNTDPVNLISFDANFTSSGAGAAGLLSVLWDSNTIGTVDERTIGQGSAHYTLHFTATESNSTHVLSFRLDPFTNIQSTVVITNVVLGQQGVVQPFSLSTTTNRLNGAIVYQLTGQAGFDYGLQASSNLTDWTQIAVLENTNGVVSFSDQSSTNSPMRFYRAVAPY